MGSGYVFGVSSGKIYTADDIIYAPPTGWTDNTQLMTLPDGVTWGSVDKLYMMVKIGVWGISDTPTIYEPTILYFDAQNMRLRGFGAITTHPTNFRFHYSNAALLLNNGTWDGMLLTTDTDAIAGGGNGRKLHQIIDAVLVVK